MQPIKLATVLSLFVFHVQVEALDAVVTFVDKHQIRVSNVSLHWTFTESDSMLMPGGQIWTTGNEGYTQTLRLNRARERFSMGYGRSGVTSVDRDLRLADIDRINFTYRPAQFREGANIVGLTLNRETSIRLRTREIFDATGWIPVLNVPGSKMYAYEEKLTLYGANFDRPGNTSLLFFGDPTKNYGIRVEIPKGRIVKIKEVTPTQPLLEYLDDKNPVSIFYSKVAVMRVWAKNPPFIKDEMSLAQKAIQKIQNEKSATLIQEIVFVP